MAGFEPTNVGVKVRCLTTWLHPHGKNMFGIGITPNPEHILGWVMGLEPTTPGTTIRCYYQLSYTHHIFKRGSPLTRGAHAGQSREKHGTPEGIRTPGPLLRRQLLYPTELQAHIRSRRRRGWSGGAGDGNRTRIPSLEGWCPGHCATPACALRNKSSALKS